MTKHLKIVIYQPLQIFAFRSQRTREPLPSLGVMRGRIRVVAIVFLVPIARHVQCHARLGPRAQLLQDLRFRRGCGSVWCLCRGCYCGRDGLYGGGGGGGSGGVWRGRWWVRGRGRRGWDEVHNIGRENGKLGVSNGGVQKERDELWLCQGRQVCAFLSNCQCLSCVPTRSEIPRLSRGSRQRRGSRFLAPHSPSTEHTARTATPSPAQ